MTVMTLDVIQKQPTALRGLQVSGSASLAGHLRFLQSDDGAGASYGLFPRSIKTASLCDALRGNDRSRS